MSRTPTYKINENFFESIDTQERAYVLGLWYADGYNALNKRIVLTLQASDKEILEKVSKAMESTIPVHIRTYKHEWYPKGKTSAYLEIARKKMSLDLAALGCGQKKTDRIRFPSFIPVQYQRHFIRGFMDGDGCIYKRVSGRYTNFTVTFIGNPDFIEDLRRVIGARFGRTYCVSKQYGKIKTLHIVGNKQSREFLDWIYQDASIYLERKHYLYEDLKKWKALSVGCSIKLFDKKTKKIVATFGSQRKMASHYGLSASSISLWKLGKLFPRKLAGLYIR